MHLTQTKSREYVGILALVSSVLLLMCLGTYDPADSSFNSITYKANAENQVGRWGAHVSDLLFQSLGYSSFLLLLPLGLASWTLLTGRPIPHPYLKGLGLVLLTCVLCTGLQLASIDLAAHAFRPGGVAGVLFESFLISNFNIAGALVLLTGAFIVGFLAITTLTLQGILSSLHPIRATWTLLRERTQTWRDRPNKTKAVVTVPPPRAASTRELDAKTTQPSIQSKASMSEVLAEEGFSDSERREASAPITVARRFVLPPLDILTPSHNESQIDEASLMEQARSITEKLAEFDVNGSVTQIHPGPVVTTYEFKPDAGVKYSRITNLVDDLCLGIRAESIRIDRIPGKATVGIEVPNPDRDAIFLRELIESTEFRRSRSRLTMALGRRINGNVYVTDLARMPHLLIAGSTGAGKSVALNCMITSILYKTTPDEVKFIFIDPKRLELGMYAEIPHLLTPIVTDPKEAANALLWATAEMESRYKKLALKGVRNLDQYNTLLRSTGRQLSLIEENTESDDEGPLPYLVLVIDELADLMMVSSREVEESISRLAAMARAVGIHLILATQRPSVDVITGVIKANFPSRIAFKVATKVDSRTIIDSNGAEQLLGSGDMLFVPPGSSRLVRIHGAYVSEKETHKMVEHLRRQGRPAYDRTVLTYGQGEVDEQGNPVETNRNDPLYKDAVRVVVNEGRASTSLLQRRLSVGYGRAAKLIDLMHQNNLVGPAEGSKPREVLVGLDFLERLDS